MISRWMFADPSPYLSKEPLVALPPFVQDAAERSVKSFAQGVLATFGAGALDVLHADWGNALSLGLGAAVLSVLTSVGSFNVGRSGTASLTAAVEPVGRHAAT
jgi:hypothetical protein